MAAAMVRGFMPPGGVKVRVLFDAFYLCPQVAGACEGNGFTFFSVAARNRTFTTDGKRGRRRWMRKSIARLMPGLIRHKGGRVRMRRSRGQATLRIASADGHLSRIGRVRMVVSKRPRGPWKKCIAVVTNEAGLRPREVVAIYERRWLIEVLFKELRQDLGAGGLPDDCRGGDRPPPARLLPGPPAADPPEPGGCRRESQGRTPASHAAARACGRCAPGSPGTRSGGL
jgi:hypothetical protein